MGQGEIMANEVDEGEKRLKMMMEEAVSIIDNGKWWCMSEKTRQDSPIHFRDNSLP